MERKIGEIFEYNGEWYQCMKGNTCNDCAFYRSSCGSLTGKGSCRHDFRGDATNVIFKKLEKVGEPFERNGYMYQEYKAHTYPLLMSGGAKIPTDNGFAVIIKQNKEDMEEKAIKIKKEDIKIGNKVICLSNSKPYVITETNCRMKYDGDWHDCVIYTPLYDNPYKCFVRPIKDFAQNFVLDSAEEKEEKHSNLENTGKNLKPFNLEAAKAGKPVCTRDGRKARIICFDRDWDMHIVALVADPLGESVHYYLSNGKVDFDRQLDDDLMMLPEKKEGWVNVYYNKIDGITFSKHPHTSKEEAIKEAGGALSGRIDTVKISWEE